MDELRITPIGTCRIHTPLKRGSTRYPIKIEMGRNYGFVHSAAEALQQIRFLQAEIDIPAEVAPLIVNGGKVAPFADQTWSPADLHLVEISSAKKLTSGDHAVQINHIYRHFADFFANRERSRTFWSLVRAGHFSDLKKFVRDERPFRLLSPDDRELLLSISYEQQSFKAIKSEMAEIVDRLGTSSVAFVTHVNATTPDDELISSRDRLIRWVKLAAEQLEVKAFDPTTAMVEVGQELALDNAGLDLTHYTPGFSDRIYDELHRFQIAELIGSSLDGDGGQPSEDHAVTAAAQFEAALQIGDFLETAREIHSAIDRFPDSLPMIELRGIVRSKIGDFAGAAKDLACRGDDKALSQPHRVALLNALVAIEDYDKALAVASNLISDEYDDPEIYSVASKAAEHVGKTKDALDYAKQAYRLDRNNLAAALLALTLLVEHSTSEQVEQWREELLESFGQSSSGAFELCEWGIQNNDTLLFSTAISAVAEADKSAAVDLVEDAFRSEMYGAVADSVEVLVGLGRLAPPLAKRRAALIDEILDKNDTLFQTGHASSAYRCAKSLSMLGDLPPGQLRTRRVATLAGRQVRTWIRDVRKEIRAAENDKDAPEVIRVAEKAGVLVKADAAIAVAYARALDQNDRTSEALRLLGSVEPHVASDRLYRRWTGRIAAHAEEYGTALDMYGSLLEDSSTPAKLRAEAERILTSLGSRAVRQLRKMILSDRFEDALSLAGAITRRTGETERVQRELARMYRRLRSIVLSIEHGEGDEDDLEHALKLIIRIRPGDQSMLRRLALEYMRQFRFAEAAEAWNQVRELAPDNESAARAFSRCEALARRRSGNELHAAA